MEIQRYIKKIKNFKRIFLVLRYLLLSLNLLIGGFVLSALIDAIFPLPIIFFHLYWFGIVFTLIIFLIFLVIRILQNEKDIYIIFNKLLNEKGVESTKDELINAYEIEQSLLTKNINYSTDLSKKYLDDIKEKIQLINPKEIVNFNRLVKVIPLNIVLIFLTLILYFIPPNILKESVYKILLTRSPEVWGIFIFPRNVKVPINSSCDIKVIVDKNYAMYRPIFFIKRQKEDNWIKIANMVREETSIGVVYKYRIENISTTMYYKVKFRGVSTRVFTIKPIMYPIITRLKLEIFPPEYTKIKPYILESFNETKYLYGSKVNFTGKVNKSVGKMNMWFNGKYYKVDFNKKNEFFGSVVVKESGELWFDIEDTEGMKNLDIVKYRIDMVRDEYPFVEILSPEKDIVIEKNSKVSLVYSAKDDFGISKINLILNFGKENKILVLDINDKFKNEIFDEYILDTAKYNLNYGDEIFYKIVVYDNDTIFGPKYTETKLQKIEIFSFEKKHEVLQDKIKKFNEKILDILAREIEVKDDIENLTISQMNLTKIENITTLKKLLNNNLSDLKTELNDISNQMITDPYISMDTYLEFKNLEKSFDELIFDINPKILSDISNKNFHSSLNRQNIVIDTLERISFINDDLLKRQNMSNINTLSKDILSSTKELISEINQIKSGLTNEQKIKLENILNQIKEKISKLNSMLKTNAEETLPQEFINRRDVKNVDVTKTQDLLNSIDAALSMGDVDSVVQYAKQLLKELENITKLLESASSEVLSSDMNNYENKINNLEKELDNIIYNQEIVYSETQKLNDFTIRQVLGKQAKNFDSIREKVEYILKEINDFKLNELFNNSHFKFQYISNMYDVSRKIQDVKKELEKNIIINSPLYVLESLKIWEKNNKVIENLDPSNFSKLIDKNNEIYEEIKKLNNIFEDKIEIEYSNEQLKTKDQLVQKQKEIRDMTKNFIRSMKDIGKKSYLITPQQIESANIAYSHMEQSENKLLSKNFLEARESQKVAIDELNKIKSFYNENRTQMQQMKSGAGKPMVGQQQYKSNFVRSQGLAIERIKLPSVNDYIPPKEFRENIIRSLSEKYPEEDNKDIQRYYKELLR